MGAKTKIRGVLGNFLGTYTSRYSDYEGYWLFGFLVANLDVFEIDLLAEHGSGESTPFGFASQSAADKFATQMAKAGLQRTRIREASLVMERSAETRISPVNGRQRPGHHVRFCASAVMEGGRKFQREVVVFVAPHDAAIESRSTRAT
jgi:hypothetical protein